MAPVSLDRESSTRRAKAAPDSYREYLNSASWRMTRNRALRRANYRCQRCGTKRDPNVHHKTYDRMGAELDSDLEVLCFSCHNGHHLEEAYVDPSKVYVRLVSEVVQRDPFAQFADIADETKRMCVKHKVAVDVALIDKAISLVCATRLKDRGVPYQSPVERKTFDEPLSHAQAVEMLARLRVALQAPAVAAKAMPVPPKPLTQFQVDRMRAFQMLAQEIAAAAERCDALEAQDGAA